VGITPSFWKEILYEQQVVETDCQSQLIKHSNFALMLNGTFILFLATEAAAAHNEVLKRPSPQAFSARDSCTLLQHQNHP